MRTYLSAPILVLLALLQVTLMPYLAVAHVRPDLVLTAVVCWALFRGPTEGAVWGFVGGLALDLLSGAPFGVYTMVLTVVGAVAGVSSAMISRDHVLLLPAVILGCTVLQQGTLVWLLKLANQPLSWDQVLTTVVLPAALLNLLVSALFYPLAGLFNRRPGSKELGW
jgi:rod shape-determining protein MreD